MPSLIVLPGPGRGGRQQGDSTLLAALNQNFQNMNSQLGRLAPNGGVLVAYTIMGVRPAIDRPGNLVFDLRWTTATPTCMAVLAADGGDIPCGEPATWATPPTTFLCERHAGDLPEGVRRDLISEVVACLQREQSAGEGGSDG